MKYGITVKPFACHRQCSINRGGEAKRDCHHYCSYCCDNGEFCHRAIYTSYTKGYRNLKLSSSKIYNNSNHSVYARQHTDYINYVFFNLEISKGQSWETLIHGKPLAQCLAIHRNSITTMLLLLLQLSLPSSPSSCTLFMQTWCDYRHGCWQNFKPWLALPSY